MRSLLTLCLSLALSVALTYLFVRWAAARRIVAAENHRSMHKGAIPTGGGVPLLAAAFAASLVLWPLGPRIGIVAAGTGLLALVSWIDDVRALSRRVRFLVHLAAAALLLLALPRDALVFHGALPLLADRIVAGLGLVWFMNLYNFMDGIDGIAGVETITIAAAYVAVAFAAAGAVGTYHGLALATAGAAAGFLVWNWAPARIFMGDVGSVPLGFMLGAMMIDIAVTQSLTAAVIPPLYYVADATITLLRRVARGEKPWEAHRDHAYQRAARGLGGHAPVVVRIAVANALLTIAAVLALTAPLPAFLMALVIVAILLLVLERAAARSPSDRLG